MEAIDNQIEPLWTDHDVAKAIQGKTSQVRRLRAAGDGPPYLKIRKNLIRYRPQDVHEWLDSRLIRGAAEASC
jgi:hypothetical protein